MDEFGYHKNNIPFVVDAVPENLISGDLLKEEIHTLSNFKSLTST